VLPSTILHVTANYNEFYPALQPTTNAAARAAALPFIVSSNCLYSTNNTKLPTVYYIGDGVLAPDDDLGSPLFLCLSLS